MLIIPPAIIVYLQKNEALEKAIKANESYIKSETLTHTLLFEQTLLNGIEIEFDDIKTKILNTK